MTKKFKDISLIYYNVTKTNHEILNKWITTPFKNCSRDLTRTDKKNNNKIISKKEENFLLELFNEEYKIKKINYGLLCEMIVIVYIEQQTTEKIINIKPVTKNGYKPDFISEHFIGEIKGRKWTSEGTAGEKIPAVPYKYGHLVKEFNKSLIIILAGYQEYEYEYEKINIFSNNIDDVQRGFLDFCKKCNIYFVKYSDILKDPKHLEQYYIKE